MAARQDIATLLSYVLCDRNREILISSGLEAVPKESRIAALRGLQDLGWISHGGLADFESSYSLTKEGRLICSSKPAVCDLPAERESHVELLRMVDSGLNGKQKDALRKLIETDCELGNWDSALIHCYELRKHADKSRDVPTIAFACFYQGRVERAQNRWGEALESYLKALEMYIESGDRKGVCATNRAMGIVYGAKGDHASAIRCFESSLSLARDTGDRDAEAKAEANLAIIYDLEGRIEESEKAHRNCLGFFLEINDLPNAMRTSINLGVLYTSTERFDMATEHFDKAISSSRTLQNREVLGIALVNAGYCLARMGKTDDALRYTDEAVSIFREPNNMNMLALAYRNYGTIECRNRRDEVGFQWFEKGVRAAKASGVEDTMAVCCYEYGMALIKSTLNLSLARKLLKRAATIYRSLGNTEKARSAEATLAAA